MSDITNIYKCEICDKTVELEAGKEIPECCGQKMVLQLPKCRTASAEMENLGVLDEPCDDGRADLG